VEKAGLGHGQVQIIKPAHPLSCSLADYTLVHIASSLLQVTIFLPLSTVHLGRVDKYRINGTIDGYGIKYSFSKPHYCL